MTGGEKFSALLQLYLDRQASDDEVKELMFLIRSGEFDALLKELIGTNIENNNMKSGLPDLRGRQIIEQILNAEKQTAKLIPVRFSPVQKLLRIAAAAVLLIVIITIKILMNPREKAVDITTSKLLTLPAKDSIIGEKKYVRLEDGSRVLINKGSSIFYPVRFSGNSREITLSGEAYFDIAHDTLRPFIVHAGHINTTVLGTAFNIKAYPNQKLVTVTVTRGKVKVSDDNKMLGIITPNESISVNKQNNSYKQEIVNADKAIEWKNKYLVLDSISFEAAAVLIEQKYHVKISFLKESLKTCHISATFMNDETLEQVLNVLTGVIDGNYKIQPNDQVIIGGTGCS